jgi:hypothetical protein
MPAGAKVQVERPADAEQAPPKAPGMGKQYDDYIKTLRALRNLQKEDNPRNREFDQYVRREQDSPTFLENLVNEQREEDRLEELAKQEAMELEEQQQNPLAAQGDSALPAAPAGPVLAPTGPPPAAAPNNPQPAYGHVQQPQNPPYPQHAEFPQYSQTQYPAYQQQQPLVSQQAQHEEMLRQQRALLQQEWAPQTQYHHNGQQYFQPAPAPAPGPAHGQAQGQLPPQANYGQPQQINNDMTMTDLLNMDFDEEINEENFIFDDY